MKDRFQALLEMAMTVRGRPPDRLKIEEGAFLRL